MHPADFDYLISMSIWRSFKRRIEFIIHCDVQSTFISHKFVLRYGAPVNIRYCCPLTEMEQPCCVFSVLNCDLRFGAANWISSWIKLILPLLIMMLVLEKKMIIFNSRSFADA